MLSISYWWAWVEEDGVTKKYSVWAGDYGRGKPDPDNFMWNLQEQINVEKMRPLKKLKREEAHDKIMTLVGKEVAWPTSNLGQIRS